MLFQLVTNKIQSSGLRLLVIIVSMVGVSLLVADGVLTPAVRWACVAHISALARLHDLAWDLG